MTKILTAKEFCRIGRLWGGIYWHGALALAIGRSKRTVGLYASGAVNIPPKVRSKIAEVAACRSEELADAARDLLA